MLRRSSRSTDVERNPKRVEEEKTIKMQNASISGFVSCCARSDFSPKSFGILDTYKECGATRNPKNIPTPAPRRKRFDSISRSARGSLKIDEIFSLESSAPENDSDAMMLLVADAILRLLISKISPQPAARWQ